MGDVEIDFFKDAFKSMINFHLKANADKMDYETLFKTYNDLLQGDLKEYSVLSYITSHDDSSPYDSKREKPMKAANWLFLTPGASQVYYGDELARSLEIDGTNGDATLRSFMNWDEQDEQKEVLEHWQKLGRFKNDHPSMGAGAHKMISNQPYLFQRSIDVNGYKDEVIIGLDLTSGKKELDVSAVFQNDIKVRDAYSGQKVSVSDGKVIIDSPYNIVLLEKY